MWLNGRARLLSLFSTLESSSFGTKLFATGLPHSPDLYREGVEFVTREAILGFHSVLLGTLQVWEGVLYCTGNPYQDHTG